METDLTKKYWIADKKLFKTHTHKHSERHRIISFIQDKINREVFITIPKYQTDLERTVSPHSDEQSKPHFIVANEFKFDFFVK